MVWNYVIKYGLVGLDLDEMYFFLGIVDFNWVVCCMIWEVL